MDDSVQRQVISSGLYFCVGNNDSSSCLLQTYFYLKKELTSKSYHPQNRTEYFSWKGPEMII